MKKFCAVVLKGKEDLTKILIPRSGHLFSGEVREEDALGSCLKALQVSVSEQDVIWLNERKDLASFLIYIEEGATQGKEWVKLTELAYLAKEFGPVLCEALGKFWPQMSTFDERLANRQLPNLFYRSNLKANPQNIVFFPGTFNPWHEGHMACANLVPQDLNVIVIPDFNPWKKTRPFCPWKKFYDLANLLRDTSHSVFPGFLGLDCANPTVEWLPKSHLKEKKILLGADSFMNIIDWKDALTLLSSLTEIFVVPRLEDPKKIKAKVEKIQGLIPQLKICILPSHRHQAVSSTILRKKD